MICYNNHRLFQIQIIIFISEAGDWVSLDAFKIKLTMYIAKLLDYKQSLNFLYSSSKEVKAFSCCLRICKELVKEVKAFFAVCKYAKSL